MGRETSLLFFTTYLDDEQQKVIFLNYRFGRFYV